MSNSSPLVAYASDSDDEAVETMSTALNPADSSNKRKSIEDTTEASESNQSSNDVESEEPAVIESDRQCSSCQSTNVLYRCPSCDVDSCSLACVNAHKAETGCSGKRPRSEFVPLSKFTDRTLTSDLFFLDEVRRLVDSSARNPLVGQVNRAAAADPDAMAPSAFASTSTTPRFVSLQKACSSHGIRLLLMPDGMKRHQQNSSSVQGKSNLINWTIELKIHSLNQSITVDRVNSDIDWMTLLQAIKTKADERSFITDADTVDEPLAQNTNRSNIEIAPKPTSTTQGTQNGDAPAELLQTDVAPSVNKENRTPQQKIRVRSIQQSLNPSVRSWLEDSLKSPDDWSIVMQVPMQSAQDQRYYLLDKSSSIVSSMKDCTIVEFPTVIFVSQSDLSSFPPALSREERSLQQLQARKERESKLAEAAKQAEAQSTSRESQSSPSPDATSTQSSMPPPPGIFKRWAV